MAVPIALRAPRETDLAQITDVLAARERADGLEPGHWQELVLAQWRSSEFDPGADAVVAEATHGLSGVAVLFRQGGFAAVHPEADAQAAGTQLLVWIEERARATGRERHRQLVGQRNAPALALLESRGYRQVRSYIQMAKDLDGPLPAVALPPGVEITPPDPDRDASAMHQLDELAFSASPDSQPHTLEQFREEHLQALTPELSAIAWRDGEPVGNVLCQRRVPGTVLVDLLAVAPDARGIGLGAALLRHAFTAAAAAGTARVILYVASDNPTAFRLYERSGMAEVHRNHVLEKPVSQTEPA